MSEIEPIMHKQQLAMWLIKGDFDPLAEHFVDLEGKMTLEEKKALYRASFCQTLAELEAPNGEWKSILGCVMVAVSVGIWGYFWMKSVVYGPLPDSITSDEKQKAQIDRMIAIRANPIEGIASNYDYEKGQWKK